MSLAVPGGSFDVPPPLRETAFALIGLQVGLRFTVATVREVGRLVVPVLLCIGGLLVACFGLAVALVGDDGRQPARRLSRDHARRPVRGARGRVRRGLEHHVRHRDAGLRVIVMVLLAPVAIRALVGRAAVRS